MYGDARPLFVVTEIVITGLIIWVGYVLLKLREPWVRATSLAPSAVEPAALAPEKIADEKIAAAPEKEAVSDPRGTGSLRSQDDKPKND